MKLSQDGHGGELKIWYQKQVEGFIQTALLLNKNVWLLGCPWYLGSMDYIYNPYKGRLDTSRNVGEITQLTK